MDAYNEITRAIALSMGAAWASGINLYATILVLGALGATQNVVLPEQLHILMNPLVMAGAGLMFVAEFIADKVPGVDTGWDALHTFIRIPAGAVLAAGAVGDVSPALTLTAAILGGGITAGVHATKAGSRALINTSPEPFSNWTASISEDVIVVAGIWTALNHPLLFIGFFILFIGLIIWLLPKIWRGLKRIFAIVAKWFKSREPGPAKNDS